MCTTKPQWPDGSRTILFAVYPAGPFSEGRIRTHILAETAVFIGCEHANAENLICLTFRQLGIYGLLHLKDSLKTGQRFPSRGHNAKHLVFSKAGRLQSQPKA